MNESHCTHAGLVCHHLDDSHCFYSGRLPEDLNFGIDAFKRLWEMHPPTYSEIMMHGKPVKLPRYQQAYGKDYHFSGKNSCALPVPEALYAIHSWAKTSIDERLNGLLVNFYEGVLGHYIGSHRDSTKNMVTDAPIVTVSLGETRTFRIRPWKGHGFTDFEVTDGSVIVLPYSTNLHYTHEVLKRSADVGRRISVTLRAFQD